MMMKDPLNRTKVVIRHLPPSISQSALTEQIDGRFSGRYNWFSFRPGKISQKNQHHSRAYVNFQNPEDVVEFAEFFDGHIFVNEKGSQFKALVEYAPSQHVPKFLSKKDGREGTISKDFEYVQFLDIIGKPVENLPSAEIQLERREAERAGGPKEAIIVTPLMDYVRQRRAAKNGSQRSSASGKLGRRNGGSSASSSGSSKRSSEKRRGLASVYVLRNSTKSNSSGKDTPTYMLVSRKEEQQLVSASRTEASKDGSVMGPNGAIPVASGSVEIGKRRVVLLKGKEREVSHVSGDLPRQKNATSVRNSAVTASNQGQRHDASGKIIRSILSNKDTRQSQSCVAGIHSEQQTQEASSEKGKRPPRPPNPRLVPKVHMKSIAAYPSVSYNDGKRSQDDKSAADNLHGSVSVGDKSEKHMRNKDRPDRGVWTPRRSDGVNVGKDAHLSPQLLSDLLEGTSMSQQTVEHKLGDDVMGFRSADGGCGGNSNASCDVPLGHGDLNSDLPNSHRSTESRSGRTNVPLAENAVHRHGGRRGSAHGMNEVDGSFNFPDGKLSKRGPSSHGYHERQVWVQKSGPGS